MPAPVAAASLVPCRLAGLTLQFAQERGQAQASGYTVEHWYKDRGQVIAFRTGLRVYLNYRGNELNHDARTPDEIGDSLRRLRLRSARTRPQCLLSRVQHAIARSLAGERLANADPTWLQRIVRGQRLASFGFALAILGVLARGLCGMIVKDPLDLDWEGTAGQVIRAVVFAVGVLGGVLIASIGFFLVTSLDPRETDRELPMSQRRLARWGMVIAVVLLVLGEADTIQTSPVIGAVSTALSILGLAGLAVAVPSVLLWLAGLARRVPARDAAARATSVARRLRWQLWALLGFGVLGTISGRVPGGAPFHGVAQAVAVICGVGLAVVMLLLVLSLVAASGEMSRLAKTFRGVHDQSR
jgi:hypothetical protein